MTDLTTLTDDQLQMRRAMIKWEINGGYMISPKQELDRFNRLYAEYRSIADEIHRRSVNSR